MPGSARPSPRKRRRSCGETDDPGCHAATSICDTPVFHAAGNHLLGGDHKRLAWSHDGIERRMSKLHGRVPEGVLGWSLPAGTIWIKMGSWRSRLNIVRSETTGLKPSVSRLRSKRRRENRSPLWQGEAEFSKCARTESSSTRSPPPGGFRSREKQVSCSPSRRLKFSPTPRRRRVLLLGKSLRQRVERPADGFRAAFSRISHPARRSPPSIDSSHAPACTSSLLCGRRDWGRLAGMLGLLFGIALAQAVQIIAQIAEGVVEGAIIHSFVGLHPFR